MTKLDVPLQLAPAFQPKIWGRRDLAPLYQRPGMSRRRRRADEGVAVAPAIATMERIGEAWLTGDEARFMNGPVSGLTLGEVSRQYGAELHGESWKGDRFPVLAKFIYTSDWLSVQVHPDDAYAAVHDPGNVGKCEGWYILKADRGASFLLGLKPKTSIEALRAACERGLSKKLLRLFHPKANEAVFVPPGTVHALGPGLVLFEAEQNSDLTYRLDDFGRLGLDGKPRPLHLKKGMEVARLDSPAHRALPQVVLSEPYGSRRLVVACRTFAVEELTLRKAASFAGSAVRVEALAVVAGDGRVETGAGWLGYRTGETWLIPPATTSYRLVPRVPTRLLKFYVPDLARDFVQPLTARRGGAAKLSKIVFLTDQEK
ncbi:MAG TPA: type I phosphomannose isomerase catalytic subunit [Terriglobia bacterium]|nr:type I phosphomannose isomerase catalytic subunit [Terriglobia bacterium]